MQKVVGSNPIIRFGRNPLENRAVSAVAAPWLDAARLVAKLLAQPLDLSEEGLLERGPS